MKATRWGWPSSWWVYGGVLLSHPVAGAVPSALVGLASGFGMGPGVSPPPWPPSLLFGCVCSVVCGLVSRRGPGVSVFRCLGVGGVRRVSGVGVARWVGAAQWTRVWCGQVLGLLVPVGCAPRGASTSGLSTQSSGWGPYPIVWVGYLIWKQASRLDAFSGYPFRTWPTSRAPGGTTGTPEVRPSRSSRTRDSPSQVSNAHGG